MRHQVQPSAPETPEFFLEGYLPSEDGRRRESESDDGNGVVAGGPFDVYDLLAEKLTDGAEAKAGKPVGLIDEDTVDWFRWDL